MLSGGIKKIKTIKVIVGRKEYAVEDCHLKTLGEVLEEIEDFLIVVSL